jgi:hypothetical protein
MRLRTRQFFFSLVGLTGLLSLSEAAKASLASFPKLPLPARFSADGYASDHAIGQADLMLPMAGNSAHNLYLDPSVGLGSDAQGYADLGLGYRWIKNKAAVLGLYVFGGYTREENNARLWVANPGLEALGSRWDVHVNGYIPMGDRNTAVALRNPSGLPFGDSVPCTVSPGSCTCTGGVTGVAGPIFYSSHSMLTPELLPSILFVQHVGDGVDIKLGYQLFARKSLKGYVGTYFFFPSQANNILGGATGLEYWVDPNVKVFASYSYDTVRRSTGALGVGVEFGGTHVHRSDPSLEERMTDPVERYLAELGHGSKIPSEIAAHRIYTPIARTLFYNIAFFSQTGGPNNGGVGLTFADCTFEHPCGPTDLSDASAAALGAVLPNTQLYFNGGTYAAANILGGPSGVTLQPGQSVSSRTPDYMQIATGTGRSTFNGGFILSNNNSLNSIIILPTSTITTGVTNSNAANTSITCSQIGSASNRFLRGIQNFGSSAPSSGIVDNVQIFASLVGVGYNTAAGAPTTTVTVSNSTLDVLTSQIAGPPILDGYGVASGSLGTKTAVTLINDKVTVATIPGVTGSRILGLALQFTSDNTITATNTSVTVSSDGGNYAYALSSKNVGNVLTVNGGTVTANGSGGTTADIRDQTPAFGVITVSPATVCTVNGVVVNC